MLLRCVDKNICKIQLLTRTLYSSSLPLSHCIKHNTAPHNTGTVHVSLSASYRQADIYRMYYYLPAEQKYMYIRGYVVNMRWRLVFLGLIVL
jgi:hypothetical protein